MQNRKRSILYYGTGFLSGLLAVGIILSVLFFIPKKEEGKGYDSAEDALLARSKILSPLSQMPIETVSGILLPAAPPERKRSSTAKPFSTHSERRSLGNTTRYLSRSYSRSIPPIPFAQSRSMDSTSFAAVR